VALQGAWCRDQARQDCRSLRRQAHDHFAAVGRGSRAGHETHLHQAGDHARQGRDVDAGAGGNVDLTLAVIVGEHREDPPHRDTQVVSGERVLPEVDHQKPADAVDEIGKIFAEIETRASGHECEIPADSGSTLLWAALRDVKGGSGWIVCAVGRIVLPSAMPAICCIYNNCKCIYNAVLKSGLRPSDLKGLSRSKGEELWTSATSH